MTATGSSVGSRPSARWLIDEGILRNEDSLPDDSVWETGMLPPADEEYEKMSPPAVGPRRIVVHHSATRTGSRDLFRALHRVVFEWTDVGYHYVIGNGSFSADGEVEPGRPEWAVGAHARTHNVDSLGICLVGDFRRGRPSTLQLRSLASLLAGLLGRYGIPSRAVLLHRELPGVDTECPGPHFSRALLQRILTV